MKLYRLEDIEGEIRPVASAHHVKVAKCADPDCPHTHLLLCTEDGRPYTMAVLSTTQVDDINSLAYEIFSEKSR